MNMMPQKKWHWWGLIVAFAWGLLAVLLFMIGCGQKETPQPASQPATDTTNVSLNQRLADLRAELNAKAPPQFQELGSKQVETLRQSGIVDSALNVGDTIPPFTLPNALGQMVSSSEILANGPMVFVFYRGVW
jgi:hypothetical protein